jgi:Fe(3+) dicitrate transport protein
LTKKGSTSDIGVRGQLGDKVTLTPVSMVCITMIKLRMKLEIKRIAAVVRYRSNIGTAVTYGFETMFDWNLSKTFFQEKRILTGMLSLILPSPILNI